MGTSRQNASAPPALPASGERRLPDTCFLSKATALWPAPPEHRAFPRAPASSLDGNTGKRPRPPAERRPGLCLARRSRGLGPGPLCGGAVLSPGGRLAVSLLSAHEMPAAATPPAPMSCPRECDRSVGTRGVAPTRASQKATWQDTPRNGQRSPPAPTEVSVPRAGAGSRWKDFTPRTSSPPRAGAVLGAADKAADAEMKCLIPGSPGVLGGQDCPLESGGIQRVTGGHGAQGWALLGRGGTVGGREFSRDPGPESCANPESPRAVGLGDTHHRRTWE